MSASSRTPEGLPSTGSSVAAAHARCVRQNLVRRELDDDRLVPAHRDLVPAFRLHVTSRHALQKARETEEGSALELLTAILMTALTFEAFLNQVGEEVWGARSHVWIAVERLGPIAKLQAIAEKVSFPLDFGVPPAQSMKALCRFRNDVVHGKPQHFEGHVPHKAADRDLLAGRVEGLAAQWELDCTLEYAERVRGDLAKLADAVCRHIGMVNPLRIGDSGGWCG